MAPDFNPRACFEVDILYAISGHDTNVGYFVLNIVIVELNSVVNTRCIYVRDL